MILPYLNYHLVTEGYDYTLYPLLESVPPKFAILKRNEWMVEQTDMVVAYVTPRFGGATKTLEYAKKKIVIIGIDLTDESVIAEQLEKLQILIVINIFSPIYL